MYMTPPRQQGFTLLEVLVTLVIFAFGMLGVAGLQMVSLTNMDMAQHRSVAVLKASEMAERVRANPSAHHLGAEPADHQCRTAHYANRNAAPENCSAGELAADDLWDWSQELAARLPSGNGVVCLDSTPDDGVPSAPECDGAGTALAVKVWWNEKPRSAAAVVPKRLVLSVVN
ncbi:MAG: type IV pilus modification protein PilV [Pseudomonadota bacterium]